MAAVEEEEEEVGGEAGNVLGDTHTHRGTGSC